MCWRHNNKSPVYDRSKVVLHGVLFRLAQFSPQHTILAVSCGRLQHATRELPKGQTHTHSTQKTFSLPRQAETVTKKQQDPQSLFYTTTTHTQQVSTEFHPACGFTLNDGRGRAALLLSKEVGETETGSSSSGDCDLSWWKLSHSVVGRSVVRWAACVSISGRPRNSQWFVFRNPSPAVGDS